ncbi:DEAD/DEAH box helicase [Agromyces aurantiacus]|uniref:DEAD/DEAH box helicase n=1 Tax=Agromyces aurantiacus TaxID=165814 RepID=A0ABV9R7J8_9MICO|nr:DEAD/DEAH box helicase [Agromyces aurantiacus]MBM7504223.1 hypothetical protein [Agromyces aurantiacus]
MVDFGAMLADAKREAPIEPRELHSQLKKLPGYGYLRDVQAQVLTAWHARRDERDIVIKVNTGGGKTIDGLIILQSYINEGLGPALYVAPSKYLVKQVIAEAQNLGLAVTQNVDGAQYLNSEAIGVINAYELVNGRTKFSDRRTSRAPAPIGAVVVDDAHAAIATTRKQLSVTIARSNPVFTELMDLFAEDLKTQSADAYLDVRDDRRGTPIRVPFWAWRNRLDQARSILRTQTGKDQPLYFDWPAIADVLELCRVVFSNQEMTITPHCPPIENITSFVAAQRRVFLTATLADDSVLVSDFGAVAASVDRPITPVTAGDIGERMILAPQEINPALAADDIRSAIVGLSREYNTVVLVPSERWAAVWAPNAAAVAIGEAVEPAIERLRTEPHVGLVVLVNRYDGIDLPDDACRVLVLDGLPEAFSPEERLDAMLRMGLSGIDDRQVQRIEQGIGRGVRSNEDHCVVFLIGPRLAQLTVDPRTLPRFSPATQAQLALSRQVATQMDNLPMSGIVRTARQALERDENWIALALQSLRNIPPQPGHVSTSAIARRNAFVAASTGDAGRACSILQTAIDGEEDIATVGTLLELQATYRDALDPQLAQQTLALARAKNTYVTKPLTGLTYTPLVERAPQTERCLERLASAFSTPAALRLEFESIVEDLVFDELRTEEFEEAMRRAALYIGLGSQRPEHDVNVGPDNLWALGENRYWVIEAKTGAQSPAIGKRDMAQLSQSMVWFGQRYDPQAVAVPVMVHRSILAYANATPHSGMKVMTERGLGEFAASLRAFAAAVADAGWTNAETVGRLLAGHNLSADALPTFLMDQRGVYNKGGV